MRPIASIYLVIVAVVTAMALLATTACFGPCPTSVTTETRDNTFNVTGSAVLVVNTGNGKIEVNAGSDDEVRVQATLRGVDRIDYDVNQDGNTITVTAEIDGGWFCNYGADITIITPTNTDVELDTSNGMISVKGIEGTGTLRTSNGMIALEDVKGDFDGSTSNGMVSVTDMEGTGFFRTSNGRTELQGVTGEFDAETSNGLISFSGNLTAGGNNRLATSNGNVVVELLGTPSVSLDASTSNGDVTCELPIMATTTSDEHLVGTIGDGEADLYIRTSNGDVTIR